eukprot:52180_1
MTVNQSEISNISIVIMLIMGPLAILIGIMILSSLVHSQFFAKSMAHVKPAILNVTYCSITLFIIENIFRLIRNTNKFSAVPDSILVACIILPWHLAQTLIYTLLLLRLKHVFNGTTYAISRKIYIF